jgi:cytochrome P450
MIARATGSLWALIGLVTVVVSGEQKTIAERLKARLTTSESQRHAFAILRLVWPNLVLSQPFIKAYPNTGTVVVTRASDVVEILDREADFAVVYEPKMRAITGGENFFLGMQDSAAYQRDTSNMRLAVRRDDLANILVPLAARLSAEIVAAASGRIDLPAAMTCRLPVLLVGEYFGTPGPSERQMIDWCEKLFWYLFIDLAGEKRVTDAALQAAQEFCAYLDATIAARKAHPDGRDDILGRCLTMQAAGLPGMDDISIRNNLFGLLIGFVPTIPKACANALAQLLARPQALAHAHRAALANNDSAVGASTFEALRFDPINPLIYRRAVRDTTVANGTVRGRSIPKGSMVMAANLSAMFDPLKVDDPDAFRTDRPWGDYMLWGHGMHTCFGAHINQAVMPQILKPLLARKHLRRASGAAGNMDFAGTPFPAHWHLEFES